MRTFTVAAGGDVLNERPVNEAGQAAAGPGARYDFVPMFAPVAPLVAWADLAICHQEIPIGRPAELPGTYGQSPFGGSLMLAPYELAAGLAATGFDRCSTASNHSYDRGAAGISSTLAALDAAHISHVGTARSADEAVDAVFMVQGVRVAHLSYTRFSNTVPPTQPWMLRRAVTPQQVAADVATVRAGGAEVVIVSLHLLQELQSAPTASDRAFATAVTALAHVDLIIHHGPHVIQPVERVNGTLVYWSVGNFVSGMGRITPTFYSDPRTLDGFLAFVRFTETAPGVFATEPWTVLICNERVSRTVHAPVSELANPAVSAAMSPALRNELTMCISRTNLVELDFH
jgi:poly-gamma-glutamate synthesis protein (capsule biosynthesis protein)